MTTKKSTMSHMLTTTHVAVAEAAATVGIKPIEMRILMYLSDAEGTKPEGVASVDIAEATGIVGSNVRQALYDLEAAGMVWFIQRQRGYRLVVTQTQKGIDVADQCRKRWEGLVST